MGLNYYLYTDKPCPTCGRCDEPLHIGKASAGWCFSLAVYPELGLNDLEDWVKKWSGPSCHIRDEYNRPVSKAEMVLTITQRKWSGPTWQERELEENGAVKGPNGLVRAKVDGTYVLGHGKGPWDLCRAGFS